MPTLEALKRFKLSEYIRPCAILQRYRMRSHKGVFRLVAVPAVFAVFKLLLLIWAISTIHV